MKKIYKSDKNRIFSGVFGGLGEYLDVDPVILRLTGVFIFFISGFIPFIIVYIIASFIVPETEKQREKNGQIPVYKKWWFWLILLITLFYVFFILATLVANFFYFTREIS